MDHRELAEFAERHFGRPVPTRLVEQLLRRTDGDPDLVVAALAQVDPASSGLMRLPLRWPDERVAEIRTALSTLDSDARAVVDAASVVGREFDLSIVEQVCRGRDVLGALDAATEAGLIRQLPHQVFRFTHAVAREVCYEALSARSRAELHEQVAAALVALGALGGARAVTVVELAHHVCEAAALGDVARLDAAVAACTTSGTSAMEQGAHDLAAAFFAQAAAFAGRAGWAPGPAGRLLVAAGVAQLAASEPELGQASLVGALRLGRRAADPGLVAAAALGLGPHPTLGALAPADAHAAADAVRRDSLLEALTGIDGLGEDSTQSRLAARLALEVDRADLAVEALAMARTSGDPRAMAEAILAVADTADEPDLLDQALREAEALEDLELRARALDLMAGYALRAGDPARAQRHLAQLVELDRMVPTAFVRWYARRAAAELAILRNEGSSIAEAAAAAALAAGVLVDPAAARASDGSLKAYSGPSRRPSPLTVRERELLVWALKGSSAKEIAEALVLGERTVETHLASIYRKLGVRTRVELIRTFGDGSSLL